MHSHFFLCDSKTCAGKYVVFGGSGCLNKEIVRGKVMVPTAACRDEGTSYHYAPASDCITVKNARVVASFREMVGLPYVKGKTWTTDDIHRETRGDLLDAPKWDARMKKNQVKGTQHDSGHFDIALELARYIAD